MEIAGYNIHETSGNIKGCSSSKYDLSELQQYKEIVVVLIRKINGID